MAEGTFISYLRVSTDRQGKSGLGIEAQREAVQTHLNGGDWRLLGEYVEVESGKNDTRPQLQAALDHAKVTGSTLVIAKLDRLSRDAYFLLGLQKAGVKFVAADMPEATDFTVGIMAMVAQQERRMISERTKVALKAAKARGVKLGNPNGAAHLQGRGNGEAVEAVKANASERAETLRRTVETIRAEGVTSVRGIADELNARGVKTARGGRWHPTSVHTLLKRLERHT
jgi:DNA invertase Pin-like site-specific DNA recombinase